MTEEPVATRDDLGPIPELLAELHDALDVWAPWPTEKATEAMWCLLIDYRAKWVAEKGEPLDRPIEQ